MSLQGTFNTAVQGMNADAHAMSIISTNIANVNTTGFKVQRSNFETILNHIVPNGSTTSVGNQIISGPEAMLSVKTMDSQNVDAQGQILTTNGTYDLALNGRGFIITNTGQTGNGIWQYTRDGAFQGQAVTLPTSTNGTGTPDQGTLLTTTGGAYVYGWKANADGTFTETDSLSTLTPVMFQTDATEPAVPTQNITLQANVASGTANRQSVSVPFIDANGQSRTLTLGFTSTIGGQDWNVDYTASNGSSVTADASTVTFDSLAHLSVPPDGNVHLTINDPTGPQDITLNLSGMTDYAGQGNITVQNVNQDGFISGVLNKTYFTNEGVLLGSYSNGELKPLYKLPIANFAAENNLAAMPGNYFVQTAEAGALTIRGLNSAGTSTGGTTFVPGALENSTVDLSDQFSRMIITQRAYSSNAEVLRTADEMTQAARDLQR